MLTLSQLKAMPEGTVFATGIVKNNPEGIFATTDYPDREIRWGAKRGNIHDWTIYYYWADMPLYYVIDSGDKLTSTQLIKKLVPCDEEAFNWYRF